MSNSYTSQNQGVLDHLRQISSLHRRYSQNLDSLVARCVGEIRQAETRIWDHYQVRLSNLDVLELGPGQLLGQMPYLSRDNRVIAADQDIIAQGFLPTEYMRMLINNGVARTLKTLGRKVLGVDRRYHKELCSNLGVTSVPRFDIRQTKADRLSLRIGHLTSFIRGLFSSICRLLRLPLRRLAAFSSGRSCLHLPSSLHKPDRLLGSPRPVWQR